MLDNGASTFRQRWFQVVDAFQGLFVSCTEGSGHDRVAYLSHCLDSCRRRGPCEIAFYTIALPDSNEYIVPSGNSIQFILKATNK